MAEDDDTALLLEKARELYRGKLYEQAFDLFLQLAERGNAEAQRFLGWLFRDGDGVQQDDAEAVKWFRLSAEQGDADAQTCLGIMYIDGQGVEKDKALAVKWFRWAADQGNVCGQIWLGSCYRDGKGIPKDPATALKWFLAAAEQGDNCAQGQVAWLYAYCDDIEKDSAKAAYWYRKAAESGEPEDRYRLAHFLAHHDDLEAALAIYRALAAEGYARAFLRLGYYHQVGKGVGKSMAKAAECYKQAMALGNIPGQIYYAKLLMRGHEGIGGMLRASTLFVTGFKAVSRVFREDEEDERLHR